MIKHNLSIAVLCLSGLLGLTITTSGLANNTVNSGTPLQINTTPTSPLTPQNANIGNGVSIYDQSATKNTDTPQVILNGSPFQITNNGIQLGATLNHHNMPVNGTLYLENTTSLTSTNQANIAISGSGTPGETMENCTYSSDDCTVLQVAPNASLGTSKQKLGDVSISVDSALNNEETYGKLFIQGKAYVNDIKVGTSYTPLTGSSDKYRGGFGLLKVIGSQSTPAFLSANTIYLPGLGAQPNFFLSEATGYGTIEFGPYVTVQAQNLNIGTQINNKDYIPQGSKILTTIQGPAAYITVNQTINIGNNYSDDQILPITVNILDGGKLTINGNLKIQSPNFGPHSSDSILSTINVTNGGSLVVGAISNKNSNTTFTIGHNAEIVIGDNSASAPESTVTANTLDLTKDNLHKPVIVNPTGKLTINQANFSTKDTSQNIELRQNFGKSGQLFISQLISSQYRVACAYLSTTGAWYDFGIPITIQSSTGTLYTCKIRNTQPSSNTKVVNTTQLNSAFGNSAK